MHFVWGMFKKHKIRQNIVKYRQIYSVKMKLGYKMVNNISDIFTLTQQTTRATVRTDSLGFSITLGFLIFYILHSCAFMFFCILFSF